jgi:hypothetical protein
MKNGRGINYLQELTVIYILYTHIYTYNRNRFAKIVLNKNFKKPKTLF